MQKKSRKRRGGTITPPQQQNNPQHEQQQNINRAMDQEESNTIEQVIDAIPIDLYDSLTNEEYHEILTFLQSKENELSSTFLTTCPQKFKTLYRPFNMEQFKNIVLENTQTTKRKTRKTTRKTTRKRKATRKRNKRKQTKRKTRK